MSKKETKRAATQIQSATILSESLDQIAEAIFQLAHEIKHKQSAPAVVLADRSIAAEAEGEEMMTTSQESIQQALHPCRVESQFCTDDPDENGDRFIISLRIWSDGRLRLDKKPYHPPVKGE
jgi:hypothetical protein